MSRTISYTDDREGFSGWLVYDETRCSLAAGGFRIRADLTEHEMQALASQMTLKQRLLGTNVDGAKCGIAYPPRSDAKPEAVGRFMRFLHGELENRFSMGSDMGTEWNELQRLAAHLGLPSTKYAVKSAQGLSDEEFAGRLALLDQPVGEHGYSVAQRRAGHALARIALAACDWVGLGPSPAVGLQGFGNLGRAAVCTLLEAGVVPKAVCDEYGTAHDPAGLPVGRMLSTAAGSPVPHIARGHASADSDELFSLPCDLLILAAGADAMSEDQAETTTAQVVAVGANYGLAASVEKTLHERGVLVIPDFIGGIGGSASMEALFGPRRRPSPQGVLDLVTGLCQALTLDLVPAARQADITVRQQAMRRIATRSAIPELPPYGSSPYLQQAEQEVPNR